MSPEFGIWTLVWNLEFESGVWSLKSGVWNLDLESPDLVSGVCCSLSLESGFWNLEFGVWIPES